MDGDFHGLPKVKWRSVFTQEQIDNFPKLPDPARQAVIDWANSGGFAAVHATGGTVENITDDLLAYLWRAGFKIAPLDDGEWF